MISPDTALEITGEALPTGERLRVELRGLLTAVGQDPRTLEVSLVGHVLAPERLSVAIDSMLLRSWGRAGFEGELRVSCEPGAVRRCRGVLPGVSLDLDVPDPRRSQRQRHVVEQLLPALGLVLADEPVAQGIALAAVDPGSLAERAGLRAGDVLARSNGVSLHALSDLAPGPSASALLLSVQRAAAPLESVRVSLASAAPLSDPRTLGLCVLACPALLLLLGFLPVPAPGAALAVLRARAQPSVTRNLALGALACLLLSAASAIWRQPPDAFWLLALQLGCVLGLHGIGTRTKKRLLDVLGLWLAAACAAAISGTRSWAVIIHDQLGGPWAWNAFSRPPLLFALGMCLLHAARLRHKPATGAWPAVFDGASRALIAVLCAGLFLGGAQLHADATTTQLFTGSLILSAKALTCYALIATLPRLPLTAARRAALWGGLSCASLLWPWLAPSRSFELQLGSMLCVFAAFWLLVGLWQQRPRAQPGRVELNAASSSASR